MENIEATRHLKLPFEFDVFKLKNELAAILNTEWIPHFNKNGYEGKWNSIALYAQNGDASNIFATQNAVLEETEILKNSPYIKSVIDSFKCPLLSVRLLRLQKGAFIKPHRDHELGYEDGNFRIHIPIITNPNINFILDGVRLEMLEGECWYTNVNYVHSVSNNGAVDRTHLVIDGERNDWSDELFFSLAPKSSFFPEKKEVHSLETMKQIVAALKLMDTEGAKETITQMQQQINELEAV